MSRSPARRGARPSLARPQANDRRRALELRAQRAPGPAHIAADPPLDDAPVAPDPRVADPADNFVVPGHEDVVGALEPGDLHQRRLGQHEDARDQRRAGDFRRDDDGGSRDEMPGRQEVDAGELRRDQHRARHTQRDERAVRRQPGDPQLELRPQRKRARRASAVRERPPAPFLEQEQQGCQHVEHADERHAHDAPQHARRLERRGTGRACGRSKLSSPGLAHANFAHDAARKPMRGSTLM